MAKAPYPAAAESEGQSAQGGGQERHHQKRDHRRELAWMLRKQLGRLEPHNRLSHNSGRKPEQCHQPEAEPPVFPAEFHPPVCIRSTVNSRERYPNRCISRSAVPVVPFGLTSGAAGRKCSSAVLMPCRTLRRFNPNGDEVHVVILAMTHLRGEMAQQVKRNVPFGGPGIACITQKRDSVLDVAFT